MLKSIRLHMFFGEVSKAVLSGNKQRTPEVKSHSISHKSCVNSTRLQMFEIVSVTESRNVDDQVTQSSYSYFSFSGSLGVFSSRLRI